MADSEQSGNGGAGGAPPPVEAKKQKEAPRFGVKLLTNAIIDGKTHKAGKTIGVTFEQAVSLERDGTIPRQDD